MRLSDRRYRLLKRLQVLTGLVPVGLFVVLHLLTNARALGGEPEFHRAVEAIARIPHLPALEVLFVALPMLAHVVLGAALATAAQAAEDRGYPRAWMQVAQRASGSVLVVYVVFHVWSTRLAPDRPADAAGLFALIARQLAEPPILILHALGVVAAAFHLGNGLVAAAGPWGLRAGPAGVRVAAALGAVLTAGLSLLGIAALLAIADPRFRWLAGVTGAGR